MNSTLITLMTCLVLLGGHSSRQSDDPVRVYAALDGVWEGVFVGYDETGLELYRIAVRQEYETINPTTQTVRVRDSLPDGTVITGEGENTARRLPDGMLQLTCVVRKSTGEVVEHVGRLIKSPEGDEQVIWHSKAANRTEIFRESVRTENGSTIYEINGLGRYHDSLILMNGRYVRQDDH